MKSDTSQMSTSVTSPTAPRLATAPVDSVPIAPSAYLERMVRRVVDIVVSAIVLIATMPLMLIIGAIIKWDSPGPALFWQTRIGRGERPFRFVKFRTMHPDARERFPELYTYNYTQNEVQTLHFKTPDDPRHTRFGSWLRRTSIDELPNAVNVLLGHMTLVGPRPEIPEMWRYYSQTQRAKFSVKPGITGLAQTNGRGLLSLQKTIALDCQYVKERSLLIDVKILCQTVVTSVKGWGAH